MAENSKIEWTDHTFNPWLGCTEVSPACDHCYARTMMQDRYGKAQWGNHPRVRTSENNWKQPLKWNRDAEQTGVRRKVFCASLADVFDNQVDEDWREALWELIRGTQSLDWLLLTKRPQNIVKMLPKYRPWDTGWPNVWLGTTIENRREGERRAVELAKVPAVMRFWSCEPLLEDLGDLTGLCLHDTAIDGGRAVGWVIGGGESGPGARAVHPVWLRSVRDQCAVAGVPFFFKQWGDWVSSFQAPPGTKMKGEPIMPWASPPGPLGNWRGDISSVHRVGKACAGALLDGVEHKAMPA